jgi:multidrug efflux pump subunit AcrB
MGSVLLVLLAFGRLIGLPLDAKRAAPDLVVSLQVSAPGHDVADVEASITQVLEEAAGPIPGVTGLRSESRADRALIEVVFSGSTPRPTDPLAATRAVRDAVVSAMPRLPPELAPPTVAVVPDEQPVLELALEGDAPLASMRSLADELGATLATVAGVAALELCGGERELTVTVDPARLAAFGKSLTAVRDALADGRARTPADLGATRLTAGGAAIALSDVAVVADGPSAAGCSAYRDDRAVVLGTIRRRTGSDAATVRAALAERLAGFGRNAPPGVKVTVLPTEGTVDAWIELRAGASPEKAAQAAADAARRTAGVTFWRAQDPRRVHVRTADPARLRDLDGLGLTLRRPAAEERLVLRGVSMEALERAAADVVRSAAGPAVAAGVDGAQREPALAVELDATRLATVGARREDVTLVLGAARSGIEVGFVERVPVRLRLPHDAVPGVSIPGAAGKGVPISAVADVRQTLAPVAIVRGDRRRQVTVWLRATRPLALVELVALMARIAWVPLAPGVEASWR